ncbi:hypothetical protein BRC81_14875 [Halobacteriales archaeon QS_1_68_20]|nr:MAG: hypothetical protein BRC81_14875 [Halobacteriales archaeon QS_1_68_20]
MRILADANVPAEYVAPLRGDGHEVTFTRGVDALGPDASDERIVDCAESEGWALLSTDVKDFGNREAAVPVFVAPQHMCGGEVRTAVGRIEALPFDPARTEPLWSSSV